jgi:hypothetical protein
MRRCSPARSGPSRRGSNVAAAGTDQRNAERNTPPLAAPRAGCARSSTSTPRSPDRAWSGEPERDPTHVSSTCCRGLTPARGSGPLVEGGRGSVRRHDGLRRHERSWARPGRQPRRARQGRPANPSAITRAALSTPPTASDSPTEPDGPRPARSQARSRAPAAAILGREDDGGPRRPCRGPACAPVGLLVADVVAAQSEIAWTSGSSDSATLSRTRRRP